MYIYIQYRCVNISKFFKIIVAICLPTNARHNGDHATNLPFSVSIIDHFTGVVTFLSKPLPLFYNPAAQKMHVSSYFNAISVLTMILSFKHGIVHLIGRTVFPPACPMSQIYQLHKLKNNILD